MLLNDRVVLVAGVGAGLGREVARLCLRDGARVVLAARRESALQEAAEALDPGGTRVAWRAADITREEDDRALAELATSRFGALHAVVQVAAYEQVWGGLEETDFEAWRRAFDTNVLGTMKLLRAAVPAMRTAGGGAVVLIGSQSMWLPQLPQAGYAASKGALCSAMYYLARDLAPDRIRVNMVVPSWMWGPAVEGWVRWQAGQRGVPQEEITGEIAARIPMGRIVPDEDVAEAVVFLASERARFITGQTLLVNGGELMR